MKSDNLEPIRPWRTYADEEWARLTSGCQCPPTWNGVVPPPCRVHNPPELGSRTYTSTGFDPDPLTAADEEPWRWTCPTCGSAMPREQVAGHREAGHSPTGGAILWLFAALLILAAIRLDLMRGDTEQRYSPVEVAVMVRQACEQTWAALASKGADRG